MSDLPTLIVFGVIAAVVLFAFVAVITGGTLHD